MSVSKKLLSVFLAFTMLLIAIPLYGINSFASDSSDFSYTVISEADKTAEISSYTGSDEQVAIPSVIDGYTIIGIGDFAFDNCDFVTSLYIPESIESISPSAIINLVSCAEYSVSPQNVNYTSVDGVMFNSSITELVRYPSGKEATSYTVPATVTSIGMAAFTYAVYLTDIVLPDNLQSISDYAFTYCAGLSSVSMPDSVTSLGEYAFAYCTALSSVDISDNIEIIPNYAFSGSALSKVVLPENLIAIGEGAFAGCANISEVVFNDSVESIGTVAFGECSSLSRLVLPDSLTTIDYGAFYSCSSLESVSLGENVQSVGGLAFYSCGSLSELIIAGSQTTIESSSFSDTTISVVYGVSNSPAAQFANDNSIDFVDINSLNTKGDMNYDSLRNDADIDKMLEISAGIIEPSFIQLRLGDMNNDSIIDGFDVATLDRLVYKDVD